MPEFLQIVASLREQMQANLTRSDVLRALIWPMSIGTFGIIANNFSHGPLWVSHMLGIGLASCFIVYLLSYIFCLFIDRDALRSEKYNMNKMAIEHGVYGDSSKGILEAPSSTKAIENSKSKGASK